MRWLRSTAEIESSWTHESRRIASSTSRAEPARERAAYPWASIASRRSAVREAIRIRGFSRRAGVVVGRPGVRRRAPPARVVTDYSPVVTGTRLVLGSHHDLGGWDQKSTSTPTPRSPARATHSWAAARSSAAMPIDLNTVSSSFERRPGCPFRTSPSSATM